MDLDFGLDELSSHFQKQQQDPHKPNLTCAGIYSLEIIISHLVFLLWDSFCGPFSSLDKRCWKGIKKKAQTDKDNWLDRVIFNFVIF